MSWSTDASGRKTWVPWIVGTPASGNALIWDDTNQRWVPGDVSAATVHTDTRDPTPSDTTSSYPLYSRWYNSINRYIYMQMSSGVWVYIGQNNILAAWNGTDLTQFTESGDTNWTTTIDNSGPNGAARIVWTTTVAAGLKERYLAFNAGTLPDQYTVEMDVGPYSGNNNTLQRVRVSPIANWVDSTHYIGTCATGDNSGGTAARNAQTIYANGGATAYTSLANNTFAGGAFPLGRMRIRCTKSSSVVAVASQLFGGNTQMATQAYTTSSSDKVAIHVTHYGQSQAIGDSGYMYGLRVYNGWV